MQHVGWRMHYQSSSLDAWLGYVEIANKESCNDGKTTFTFKRKDSIYEKTSNRIETGSKFYGWAKFEIPGNEYSNAGTDKSTMILEFLDHQEHKYTVTFKVSEEQTGQPKYYPGIDPVISASPSKKSAPKRVQPSSSASALKIGGHDVYVGNSWIEGPVEVMPDAQRVTIEKMHVQQPPQTLPPKER